jgi:hypothetical protein
MPEDMFGYEPLPDPTYIGSPSPSKQSTFCAIAEKGGEVVEIPEDKENRLHEWGWLLEPYHTTE